MVLRSLQSLLERLYDVEFGYDVYDFLVTDRAALPGYPHQDFRRCEEELLLAESTDGAGVALYVEDALILRLEAQDPLGELNEANLADYCTALEGVSHFGYATWRLKADSPVSLLELETQAEVDKYAATIFLTAHQLGGGYPRHVFARLFERATFDPTLAPEQRQRYMTAHRCAARYCRFLERNFVRRGHARIEAMLRELRTFYRLGSAAKMRHALAA